MNLNFRANGCLLMVYLILLIDYEVMPAAMSSSLARGPIAPSTVTTTFSENIAPKGIEKVAHGANQVNTLGYVNTTRTGYEDFSSLRSRLIEPMPQLRSSFEDSNDPITTAAVTMDMHSAHKVTIATCTEDIICDTVTNQISTMIVDEKSGLAGYDDFSSLRSRLTAQTKNFENPLFFKHTDTNH